MNSFLKLFFVLFVVSENDCVHEIDIYPNMQTQCNILRQPFNPQKVDIVKIQIYYEALCSDCKIFDSTQMVPVIKKLSNYIDLKTYPYGNAKTKENNGHYIFSCQHGPLECYGNKLHACAIDALQHNNLAALFNACMMDDTQEGEGSDDRAADVCGKAFGVDSERIKRCAKSEKGSLLLKYYGDESKKVCFRYVPFVLVNGKEVNVDSENFMQAVCRALANPPEACKTL